MIVFETKLAEIMAVLPKCKGANGKEYQPYFNWGTKDVLNKYLTVKDKTTRYPLIWLIDGQDTFDAGANSANRTAKLILAMHSDKKDYFNPDIYRTDYDLILDPLLKNVITALNGSGASFIPDNYTVQRFPNYSVTKGKGATVDVWNATVLDIEITLYDNCINQKIKF